MTSGICLPSSFKLNIGERADASHVLFGFASLIRESASRPRDCPALQLSSMRLGRECKQFRHFGRVAGQGRRTRRDFWRSSIVQGGASPSIAARRRKTRFSNLAVSVLSSRGPAIGEP